MLVRGASFGRNLNVRPASTTARTAVRAWSPSKLNLLGPLALVQRALAPVRSARKDRRAGKTIRPKERPKAENVVDLMEALRRSVGQETVPTKAAKSARKPNKAYRAARRKC